MLKKCKCSVCIQSLTTDNNNLLNSTAADFTNLKTRGFLIHPQHFLFRIIESIELCFVKHAESKDSFTDTYEEFFKTENCNLSFPFGLHKSEIMTDIFVMYITMRMRQYSYAQNNENKKSNKSKKKISKLVTT